MKWQKENEQHGHDTAWNHKACRRSPPALLIRHLVYVFMIAYVSAAQDECDLFTSRDGCSCQDGYLLRVTWSGRLGNNLFQLANVLQLAKETHSEVLVAPHENLDQTSWGFREHVDPKQSCQLAITSEFFHTSSCPLFLGKHVFPYLAMKGILQTYVLPVFQPPAHQMGNTVVIHVRGGDIFTPDPPRVYVQPPVAFYNNILDLPEHRRSKILLCTEDFNNPVVEALQKQYGRRLTVNMNLYKSISAVTGAKHLILSHSSFSEALAMLAPSLESVHYPFCVPSFLGTYSAKESLYLDRRNATWSFRGFCYEYDGYIPLDEWANTPEQLTLITTLNSSQIHQYALPEHVS